MGPGSRSLRSLVRDDEGEFIPDSPTFVIASEAKQPISPRQKNGLLRRIAPRNDD
jgi:hypothetical protein